MDTRAARRDAVTAKSPGPGHLDQQGPTGLGLLGRAESEHAHQPVLVEVVVRHHRGRHRAGRRRRPRSRKAISAERSAQNSGGEPIPGQCERQRTVPSAGDPSTTTLGISAPSDP